MMLKILHRSLVFLGCRTGFEGSQVATPASFWVLLSRVQPVLARCQFTNHGKAPFSMFLTAYILQFARLDRGPFESRPLVSTKRGASFAHVFVWLTATEKALNYEYGKLVRRICSP
jgi:hypothetical protein